MGRPHIDETNNKYERLTVIEYVNNGKWKCRCDCGNEIIVAGADLRRGHTKSCGCYNREQTSKASLKDLTGQRFGELEVLERDINYSGHQIRTHWICLCHSCGTIKSIAGEDLKKIISCGCLKSKGEYKIRCLLNENNISFLTEYKFDDYKNRRYDFAIFNDNNDLVRLIEFDGIQHYYRPKTTQWSNISIEEQKKRDIEKNNIAKEKNIPLVRIPYWKLETLTINDLINNTYLVKENSNG